MRSDGRRENIVRIGCGEFMRTLITLTVCLLLAVAAVHADPIKIGWIGPLTGNSAVLGIDSVQAVQLAVDEANADPKSKHQFKLLVEDDQYDAAKTVSAYTKLASEGVVAIIASTYGGVFAIADRAEKDGIVVVNPLDCNEDIAKLPSTTLCVATQSESVGRAIAEDIRSRNLGPTAVIFDERNPFMTLVANSLKDTQGSDVVHFAGIDQSRADFNSELLKGNTSKANSFVFLGHDPMGTAMRQARGLGIRSQFYSVGTITSPGYQQLAGQAANGTLVAYWEAPVSAGLTAFLKNFERKAGRPPILQLATVPSYDTATILISALKVEVGPTKERILSHLLGLKSYSGLSGTIAMDPDGATRSIREDIFRFNEGRLERTATTFSK